MKLQALKRVLQISLLIAATVKAAPLLANPLAGSTVRICEDDAQWPPYTFYKIHNAQPTKEIIGYAIDVINEIFSKYKIHYKVTFLPWKRCLAEVKTGNIYQMALNASFSQHRQQTYLLSKPYYSTQKHYYFSYLKYPHGLTIENMQQLKVYTLGGVRGHSFESYGIDNKLISHRAQGYVELVRMLHAGRFDVFLAEHEIISGQANINPKITLDKPLAFAPLSQLKKNNFHMLISKNAQHAKELLNILNKGIETIRKSGQSQRFLEKYIQQ